MCATFQNLRDGRGALEKRMILEPGAALCARSAALGLLRAPGIELGDGDSLPLGGNGLPRRRAPARSRKSPVTAWRAAALAVLLAAPVARPAQAQWRALGALERAGAAVSASALDLESGEVIEQLNPRERLTPASLTKLVTAAAALDAWPADQMFHTRLIGAAQLRGATLEGDLVLQGAGDPSLDDDALWALAAQLRGTGLARVHGRLIVAPAPFGLVTCETRDRCDALQRSDSAYNAPLAAAGVDFGDWCVLVRPTYAGASARVRGCGVAALPIPIEGVIRTVRGDARQTLWVERITDVRGDVLHVGGDVPLGEGVEVYRSMSDPARGVGLLLKETLREIGIDVEGPVVVSADPVPGRLTVLADTEGLTLREQLDRMLRFSNNYIADVLTLDLAASLGRPRSTLSAAGQVLTDFLWRLERAGGRADPSPPILLSGSGLTPDNRLSAADLVALLAHEYRDPRHFPAFYGGLVVPRDAPFAFLRAGTAAWLDRVALKTGTMDDPRSVCGIAGYARKRDGGWIAFAAIVNGTRRQAHVPLVRALDAERADLVALLGAH